VLFEIALVYAPVDSIACWQTRVTFWKLSSRGPPPTNRARY